MSEVRVDNITGENKTDAVKFTKGINVTGIITALLEMYLSEVL